jgi:hypothetical protein
VEGLIEGYQYSFRVKAVNLGSTVPPAHIPF